VLLAEAPRQLPQTSYTVLVAESTMHFSRNMRATVGSRTLNSSSVTLARVPNLAACLAPDFFFIYAGACRLACNQLVGAAGPGGGLASPIRRRVLVFAFGLGALISGMCNMRRNSGGTVRLTTDVSSSRCSGVGRGACSRRSWCMRWLTDCGSEGVDEEAVDRELCKEGWTYEGFVVV
jgi:hypothetical protein